MIAVVHLLAGWLSLGCLVVAAMNSGEDRTHWLLVALTLMVTAK